MVTTNFATGKVENFYREENFNLINYIIVNRLENFFRWQGRNGFLSRINGKIAILWEDSNRIEIL